MAKSPWRILAAATLLAIGAAIFIFAVSGNQAAQRDFISYWAAGQQLARHANPYDDAAILLIEQKASYGGARPLIMRNPPTALFLALPLGFVGPRTGLIVWSLLLLASLVLSIRLLWELNGRTADRLHLLGYCFAPVIACLIAGQVGIFLLLGVTLFLCFFKSRPASAGAALLLCTSKPHLFVPFGLVLLLWSISRKSYRLLAGCAGSLLLSSGLALFFDPRIWQDYQGWMRVARVEQEFIPTLSVVFRLLVTRLLPVHDTVLLQFLPVVAACLWATWYFWMRRALWNWGEQGLLLLLVSVACAPYAWFSDEALLLPAILSSLYRAQDAGRSLIPFGVLAGAALLEVLAGVPMTSPYYLWTTSAWLGWYLYATRNPVSELPVGDAAGQGMTHHVLPRKLEQSR
jgi:hypothetical protein